jgi:hypothetical protein
VESWFDAMHQPTETGKNIVQRELKTLRAQFFDPPRVGEEEKEKQLTDIANIIFVYIGREGGLVPRMTLMMMMIMIMMVIMMMFERCC